MKHTEQLTEAENEKLKTLRELLAQGEQQADNGEFADYSLAKIFHFIDKQSDN